MRWSCGIFLIQRKRIIFRSAICRPKRGNILKALTVFQLHDHHLHTVTMVMMMGGSLRRYTLCASLPPKKLNFFLLISSHKKVNISIFYLHRVCLLLITCNGRERPKNTSSRAPHQQTWDILGWLVCSLDGAEAKEPLLLLLLLSLLPHTSNDNARSFSSPRSSGILYLN